MKILANGWAFPDADDFMCHQIDAEGHYQWPQLQAVLALLPPTRRVVVDGGAHVGTWARVFSQSFERVLAFEPSPDTYACLAANMAAFGCTNVEVHHAALGAATGNGRMVLDPTNTLKKNTGGRRVQPGGPVPVVAVDRLALPVLDFLKLDVEGSEVAALLGAVETIRRCRPVVLFEDKKLWAKYYGWPKDAPMTFLRGQGYRLIGQAGRDQIWEAGA